jgi:hypothetical protein
MKTSPGPGQWLGTVLEAIEPAADRRLVQAYATWQVMRRLRAGAGRSRPRTPTAHARRPAVHPCADSLVVVGGGALSHAE